MLQELGIRNEDFFDENWFDNPYDDVLQNGPFLIYRRPNQILSSRVEDRSELTKQQCDAHNASFSDLKERGKRVITR